MSWQGNFELVRYWSLIKKLVNFVGKKEIQHFVQLSYEKNFRSAFSPHLLVIYWINH